jgi:hypothetical protein
LNISRIDDVMTDRQFESLCIHLCSSKSKPTQNPPHLLSNIFS